MELRDLPSVDRLLGDEVLAAAPRPLATAAARAALERARVAIREGGDPGDVVASARAELERLAAPALRRVLNATGVIVHTNLGRAPLAPAALARAVDVGGSYSNLELDLASGTRGSRQDHVAAALARLTGAEAALVVNNNAAAVLLALAALAEGREVVVSRGELLEIGDGFRIPDVLARSGAHMVEVGTTNRTRAVDYERAIGPDTKVLLRVHQSNFRIVGFTESPATEELAVVARASGLVLVDDLGSGSLVDVGDEPTAASSLAAGADLVCFSGDKLLGGPQAGLVLGRADLVQRLRRHPLYRALRVDKTTLAALEATLRGPVPPVQEMLAADVGSLRERARSLADRLAAAGLDARVVDAPARVGGGGAPEHPLPSAAVSLPASFAGRLRRATPPLVGYVDGDRTLLNLRSVPPAADETLAAAVLAVAAE
jgi:L-seryl-tRNA(Ser) seleniumtransferase